MPVLTTSDEMIEHLVPAVRGKAHYVFAADCDQGRTKLLGLIIGFRGVLQVPEEAIAYATPTVVTPDGRTTELAVLTVPKAVLPPWAVPTLAARIGHRGPVTDEMDIIPISTDPLRLAGLLDLIARREFRPLDPAAN